MSLDPTAFMSKMATRISFTDADKALLKANAAWGSSIALSMAKVFYAYLSTRSRNERDP